MSLGHEERGAGTSQSHDDPKYRCCRWTYILGQVQQDVANCHTAIQLPAWDIVVQHLHTHSSHCQATLQCRLTCSGNVRVCQEHSPSSCTLLRSWAVLL